MLKMRLQRVGRRNNPLFRVVLTESRNPAKGGKCIEVLGSYNPHANTNQIDAERVNYWLSQGVQPSDTVHNLLVNEKVVEGKKVNVLPKKKPIIKESDEQEEKEASTPQPEASGEEPASANDADSGDVEPNEETAEKTEEGESAPEDGNAPAETEGESAPEEEKKEA